jgi:hypothetical protein
MEYDGTTWTVDVDMMFQINDERNTRRQIRRIVVVSYGKHTFSNCAGGSWYAAGPRMQKLRWRF